MSNEAVTQNPLPQTLTLGTPNLALIASANAQYQVAQSYVIDSAEMAEMASQDLAAIKTLAGNVDAERRKIVDPLNTAVKAVNDLFRPATEYCTEAERIIKGGLLSYNQKLQAEARARQAAAEETARKQREQMAEQARELAAQGHTEAAEAVRETAMVMSAPIVAAQVTKIRGVSTRTTWKGRVTDKMALIKFIAENPEFEHLLDVNATQLNALAKAMKTKMKVAGAEAYEDMGIASRAAA